MSDTVGEKDVPGVIMWPPLILLIALGAAIALELLVPLALLPEPGLANWSSWLGAVLLVAGLALGRAGARAFMQAGTNIHPGEPALKLVTSGPYRFTRNPMYLGALVALLGIALVFSLEWGLPATIAAALVLHFGVVRREERYLIRKFGAPYEAFLRGTRRWI